MVAPDVYIHYETIGPRAVTMIVNETGEALYVEHSTKGSLDRAVRKAQRRGYNVKHVEVFDWEWIMTQQDAERRAKEVWGDGPLLITRVNDAHCRAGEDWAEWWIEVPGDHRTHVLDGQGQVICRHADCRNGGKR
jgi:hypothetical protein